MLQMKDIMLLSELKQQGLSNRAISRQTCRDRKTVAKYLDRGLKVPRYKPRSTKPGKLDPDKEYIRGRLDGFPQLTGTRLYREIRDRGYEGRYTIRIEYVRTIRPSPPVALERRFETPPGEQAQVDFGVFQTVFTSDPGTTYKLHLFLFVMGYSRWFWGLFGGDQKLLTVMRGLQTHGMRSPNPASPPDRWQGLERKPPATAQHQRPVTPPKHPYPGGRHRAGTNRPCRWNVSHLHCTNRVECLDRRTDIKSIGDIKNDREREKGAPGRKSVKKLELDYCEKQQRLELGDVSITGTTTLVNLQADSGIEVTGTEDMDVAGTVHTDRAEIDVLEVTGDFNGAVLDYGQQIATLARVRTRDMIVTDLTVGTCGNC